MNYRPSRCTLVRLLLHATCLCFGLMRAAAKAADLGYGSLTILEVACDSRHDTGFLIQGKRHFSSLDPDHLAMIVRARLRGGFLLLAGALWWTA